MATEDRLVEDLRGIFDEARRSSGQVQAEALLAVAPVVLKASESERGVAYMRDRLTPESYRAICRAIGDELDRLNAEIDRLKRFEKIAGVVESAKRRITARPTIVTKPTATAAVKAAAGASALGEAGPVPAGVPFGPPAPAPAATPKALGHRFTPAAE